MLKKRYFIYSILFLFVSIFFIIDNLKKNKKTNNYKPPFVERPYGRDLPKEPAALPNEWMGYQRTYPYGKINQSNYLLAIDQAKELHSKSLDRNLEWISLGPENTGGRITDLAYNSDEPAVIYVAAASGGIYKTVNGGNSWQQKFSGPPVISMGDIALDPNNSMVLYAGTGEANASSYSFLGDGLWKSNDGGDNWLHLGLESSAYIARIIVDYNNSNRVFVAACGTLFSSNSQRGVYRSIDGGGNWEQILFISDSTAAIDLVQHPTDPDILYAAMWERIRGLNYRKSGGETSGIWKTVDGGDSWVELQNGLPTGDDVGRIGIDISISNPNIYMHFMINI